MQVQKRISTILVLAVLLVSSASFARNKYVERDSETGLPHDDSEIVDVTTSRKNSHFVEGSGMEVVEILPDDTQGLEHQKWIVRLSSGQKVLAVYNSDMCPRVPVKVGDTVGMGGQFIWSRRDGAILHWLHHDPKGNRPDGYVYLNGEFYCKE
jgi:hypothetical protein